MNSHAAGHRAGRIFPLLPDCRIGIRIAKFYDLLIFSSLLLSFECIAMGYISCTLQQVPWHPVLAVIPFAVAFSVYNFNRKTDEDEDAVNRQDRFAFTKRYEALLYYGALLSFFVAIVLSMVSGILVLLATLAPFIIGTLYSFRLLPKWTGYCRLKEIPGVKNISVGLAWGVFLAFLPVLFWHHQPGATTAITFVLFFAWGFMASLIPDMRDLSGDAGAGVRTLPVLFGRKRAARILTGVLILLELPLIAWGVVALPSGSAAVIVAAGLYSHACVFLAGREGMIHLVADLISDGQYIFFAVAAACFPFIHV